MSSERASVEPTKVALPPDDQLDPVFIHSRREAIVIFLIWLVSLLWAVPYCYVNGYLGSQPPEEIALIFGVPAWLFWGIAVPWLVADLLTVWFCFGFMKDDDLGQAPEERNTGGTDSAGEEVLS